MEKGFTKNRIELAESLNKLGWETLLVDKKMLGIPPEEKYNAKRHSLALKNYLTINCWQFDVVLYEYDTLPFDRDLFDKNTLFVARPAILDYHFKHIKFRYNMKAKFSQLFRYFVNRLNGKHRDSEILLKKIDYCLSQSDLIQVQNKKDRGLLMSHGFNPKKILVVPNGISPERILKFDGIAQKFEEPISLAFVGTFDFRKGAMDFPIIFNILKKSYPGIKLKLLGTMYSAEQVLKFFPKKHQASIEVIPKFMSEDLPGLLKDCHIGVFPSYLESFGFGALEMMCAGLPVVAYDSPGPSDFVLPELLVPTGDRDAFAKKIIALLENRDYLKEIAKQAREVVVENYCWDDIAKDVDKKYRFYSNKLQKATIAGKSN